VFQVTKINRRDFLAVLLAGMGAIVAEPLLGGCQADETASLPTPQIKTPTAALKALGKTETVTAPPAATITEPASPTATQSASPATASLPDLVVARGGEPEDLVRRALSAYRGMETFIPRGAEVIIKPNICVAYNTYEYASTTNPWVVGALVKLALEAGAKRVRVMDHPFGGTAEKAYTKSGIGEQVKAAGGEMVEMVGFKYVTTTLPDGKDLTKSDIYADILQADVLINVPVAKHHSLARLTLGMKNLMGVIHNREIIHGNLGQRLADLTSRIRPALTVIDAVRILTDRGPTGGSLDDVKKLDTLIVSPDIVAADSYAASLFGLKPEDLAYIQAGVAMELGRSDLQNLRIEEI
jgi:uncharacterized protein (DUF362 family)